ncbi:hypothetical protein [Demequina sp. NBRC 110056]|uniref:hypothetical protein n=1 Tax=Demequina sp. NBRC 110056 TaxID=1570345 RepID=UPI0009FFCF70|nr:hypothetical protein [Demequina sp. NBRC 110056]
MRAHTTWAIAAAAALVLSACSWRAETPPPDWPSPDAATVMRDDAAEREQAVVDATSDPGVDATAATSVLVQIEDPDAQERLDALGGLYVAYPDATASPSPAPTSLALQDAVTQARDGHLADALVADDADLASLLASAGLAHALSSWFAVWVADAVADAGQPVVAERTLASPSLPHPDLLPGEATAIDATVLAQLALEHDQARYAYEVLAARAGEDLRGQWLELRALHAARAEALVSVPGVEDLREAVYVLTFDQVDDSTHALSTATGLQDALGDTYAALAVSAGAEDMPWLLNAAFDAYAQAAALGDASADAYAVPALPGLTVAETSATPDE